MKIVIPKSDISSFMYVMLYGTVYVICVWTFWDDEP